jgi:hypothetical protein
MKPRSPETEIRYLRITLRHARSVLHAFTGQLPMPEDRRQGYARDVLRMISEDLAPKRRRRTTR